MEENTNRIIARNTLFEDIETDNTLRPKWLNEYIGQDKVKNK
ncbi:Holliday junction branch migration DNA helicase RuvB, partial [Vibrio parahaemolyticus]|nr:Holliday junction branch migration DNA helicase RuvB [Vibrio parahaemolyticus]